MILYGDVQKEIVNHFSKGLDWIWGHFCKGVKGTLQEKARFGRGGGGRQESI